MLHTVFHDVAVASQNLLSNAEIPLLGQAGLMHARDIRPTRLRHQITDAIDLLFQPDEVVGRDLKDVPLRFRPSETVIGAELNVVGLPDDLVPFTVGVDY